MFSSDLVKQNQEWHASDAFNQWSQFLNLFTKSKPTCPQHPAVELTKKLNKNSDGMWEGILICSEEENIHSGYTWPVVMRLYDWVENIKTELLAEQRNVRNKIQLLHNKQVHEITEFYLSGKKGDPGILLVSGNSEFLTDKLNEKEDAWNNWTEYEDYYTSVQEKNLDQSVHYHVQLVQKEQLRKQIWAEFVALNNTHHVEWLEKYAWKILEYEGMPDNKRLEQIIHKESSKHGVTLEALKKWFQWSEVSRDYLMILSKEQQFNDELEKEQKTEDDMFENFFFVFPRKINKANNEEPGVEIPGTAYIKEVNTGGVLNMFDKKYPEITNMKMQDDIDETNNNIPYSKSSYENINSFVVNESLDIDYENE